MTGEATDSPLALQIGALLSEDAPTVGSAEAEALLATVYGMVGRAMPLASERDHNFRMRTAAERDYVLKISHPAEDPCIVDFQTRALRRIALADPELPVPKVVPTLDGSYSYRMPLADGRTRLVRLLTYLDGVMLCDAPASPVQDVNLGAFLAHLDLALEGFSHPSAEYDDLLWDLRQLPRTSALTAGIRDPGRRRLVEEVYRTFDERVALALPALRTQVIHNDMNPDNVVVSPADPDVVAGILDFGDLVRAPLVCDVAIGAAYRWSPDEHPLAGAARFLRGYESLRRLGDSEIDILPDLIACRLALAVTLANWQAERFPGKRDYVMRFNAEFWSSLERMAACSTEEKLSYLQRHRDGEQTSAR